MMVFPAPSKNPRYSKGEVERAGKTLASSSGSQAEIDHALIVLEYWKAAFQEPLDEMIVRLRGLVDSYPDVAVFGRIKRNQAIIAKLRRDGKKFSLRTMDDIAGCRIVLPSMPLLYEACDLLLHELPSIYRKSFSRDYIKFPKADGYRSVHLITSHAAPSYGYDCLHCETQIRTSLQHAWATALETYDVISGAGMKAGGGSADERRFFACVSGLFARREGTAPIPEVPSRREELIHELSLLEERCNITARLRAASESVSIVSKNLTIEGDALCLLDIDYADQSTRIYAFSPELHDEAQREYARKEADRQKSSGSDSLRDVLLVRVSSARELTSAYPNYSTDIKAFIRAYESEMRGE